MAQKVNKKEIIKEILKCGKDPLYFIDNYAKIQHPTKGLVPFRTYDYQKDIIQAYNTHRRNIILKARQLGMTTITAAYIAWFMLLHRDKNILIIATKLDTAKNMIRVIKIILKYLPPWLRAVGGKSLSNNVTSVELTNGSRVKALTTSMDAGRSEAVSFLAVDEAAHIEKFEELWTGLSPVISAGGRVVLMSSPLGTGNYFHRCYEMARNNSENGFNCTFGTYTNPHNPKEVCNDRFMWWVRPDYDEDWYFRETRDKSPRQVSQEYLCSFVASGDTFIYHEDISKVERECSTPAETFFKDRNVWIWERPEPNGTYLISADTSRGDAHDYSAFHVLRLDVHPLEQVAEYKGKIKPNELGLLMMDVSKIYNNATIAPENNSGWSSQAILKIQEANYPHLYYSRKRPGKTRDHVAADPYYAQNRNDHLPGYSVTSANRIPMLNKLEQYTRLGEIKINSLRLVDEYKTFIVTDTGRPEAQRGYHDDLIMALAGGLWVREEAFLYTYRTDEYAKAMLDGMSTSKTQARQFRDFNFNESSYHPGRVKEHIREQNKIITANGEEESLDWLLTSG